MKKVNTIIRTLPPKTLKNEEGNYIGDDGDRLFTRDEVTQILKIRLDRQLKSIIERYGVSNLNELDALVDLADRINNAVDVYRNNHVYASRIEKAQDRENYELAMKLEVMGNWNTISISRIQRCFGIPFQKASKIFQTLIDLKLIDIVNDSGNTIYFLKKEEVANFINTFSKDN